MATETTVLHGENKSIRDYTGVTKFHNAGYYGERVVAATGEDWSIKNYNPDDLVEIPFGDGDEWGNLGGEHGSRTAATFFQCAPKARLVQMSKIHKAKTGKDCYCGLEDDCLPIIKEYGITSVFCSFDMICDKYLNEKYTKIINDLQTFNFFVSAGNDANSDYVELAKCDAVTTVGAYYLNGKKPVVENFTSQTEYVDFGAPDRQTVKFGKQTNVTTYGKMEGTSFSAPWLCGMACLVNDFFIDKTGKPLTYKMMRQFFLDNTVDIGDEGFDNQVGYGAVILPDPSTIDISKYVEDYEMETEIKIDTTITDNTKKPFDVLTIDEYKVICEKIPYDSIEKIDFAKCKDPSETLQSFYNRQNTKPDIIINGGLFNMSTGKNVMSFIDEGVEQNYKNNFVGVGTKTGDLTHLVKGIDNDAGWNDFITAHPVLVDNYNNTTSDTWGNASDINYDATRQVIGYDDNYIYIITVDAKVKFDVLQDIINAIGVQYAFNLDGGGSVRKMRFGKVVNTPTENRPVDNVICVYLKDDEFKVPDIEIPDIEFGEYIATTDVDICVNVMPDAKVLNTAHKGDIIVVNNIMQYQGKLYVSCQFDYEYGFAYYDQKNLIPYTDVPDVEPEPPQPETFPAIYNVDVNTTLNVRKTANGEIIDVLYPNDRIIVEDISNEWAKFRYNKNNIEFAYCSTQYITYIAEYEEPDPEPAPEPTPEPEPEFELDYSVLDQYEDKQMVHDWAKDGVTYCIQKGYMFGSEGKFRPQDNLTREEFCTVIYRILKE